MQLNDDQKKTVHQWIAEGCGLTEIQKRLREQFQVTATFLEVRLLILDLGVALKDREPVPPRAGLTLGKNGAIPAPDAPDAAELGAGGAVSVTLDRIVKPGAVISGTVRFSDGVSAAWTLDQMGRLALDASEPKYRPSAEDVKAFQLELKNLLQDRGF